MLMGAKLTDWIITALLLLILLTILGGMAWSLAVAKPSDIPWSELVPAVVGGTIGALAGGIPAYLISRQAAKEVLARDEAARKQMEKNAAFEAQVLIADLVNSVLSLHKQFYDMLAQPNDDPKAAEHPWLYVRPIGGLGSGEITISPTAAAVFAAARESDYLNDLLLLPKRLAAITAVLRDYELKRERLIQRMSAEEFDGEQGSSFLSPEEQRALLPAMIELNSIIQQVSGHLAADRDMALKLAREFGPIMRRHFSDPTYPGFEMEN